MDEFFRLLSLRSAAAAMVLALAGSAVAGDFGRPDPPIFSPFVGPAPLAGRFNETDREREMHDRVWRFLRPPGDGAGRLVRDYYLSLSRAGFASSHARYRAVGDDIAADLGTLPMTFAAICAVADVDRQRAIAVAGLPGMEPGMSLGVARAASRNAEEVARFTISLRFRFASYAYALDHLLVETPHREVIVVDNQLARLELYVRRAERRHFCSADAASPQPLPESRPIDLMGS